MAATEADRAQPLAVADGDVTSTLVATKLAPPVPAPSLLPRTDLVEQLTDARSKLCLLSAPAGWGKTSLMAAWYEAAAGPFAFLHLDPADDDAPMLWTCMIAALRTIHPELMMGADEALRTPGMDPLRRIVPSVINELSEIDEPMVLVLDDFHVLTEEAIHASITYFIDHLPTNVRLAIATRADPPIPLGRLRASGEMTEVRAGQLRLTEKEAGQLLGDRFGLEMNPASVQLLCQRTEGWPAAIHLAGLSLQSEVDPTRFVERFAGDDRHIVDYLTAEVLHRVPSARRDFLLHTSVLDRFTGPLCDAVAAVSGSDETLEELERNNLFLIPLDNNRRWYRYHNLFGEWLRHELHRTDPSVIPELHSRASRWHAEQGSLEAAITHAMAAGDHEHAGDVLDQYVIRWAHVNWQQLDRWFTQLPDAVMESHPVAAAARVWMALTKGDFADGFRWIDAAEAATDAAQPELRSTAATMTALFRAASDFVGGDMDATRVTSEVIADELSHPDSEMVRPLRSAMYAGAVGLHALSTFWTVGAREAIPLLRAAVATRQEASLLDDGFTALLALAYSEVGNWAAAEENAVGAFRLPRHFDEYRWPDLMPAHYALGKALVARSERDQGIDEIQHGLELARGFGWPIFTAYGCLVLADAADDFVEKRALVRQAREFIDASQDPGRMTGLLAAMERKLAMRRPRQSSPGTLYVESLTERELDVLRLLQSELSLREIGNELYIAHNTVKSYTKAIYRKLGVSSRVAAIQTARELALL
jgi:LuxR family maltose regulon positive regulatory protein